MIMRSLPAWSNVTIFRESEVVDSVHDQPGPLVTGERFARLNPIPCIEIGRLPLSVRFWLVPCPGVTHTSDQNRVSLHP